MLARYYASGLGRFLSVDPINGSARAPQSWNLYAYVRNNPVNAIDPTGEASYWCSRPLNVDGVRQIADHQFIAQGATAPGQGGQIRSFGDDGTDHVGEVNGGTTGFSAGTQAADRAAFDSLDVLDFNVGVISNGDVSCTLIPATDSTVATIADGVVSGQVEYSMVPELQGGANSNSAAAAIATRAASTTGSTAVQPGSRISPGANQEAMSKIPFNPGTPGDDIVPPELPGSPP